MTSILLVGLAPDEQGAQTTNCTDLAAAEQHLLRETPQLMIVAESLAASLMEQNVQMGMEHIPVIVVSRDVGPKQVRRWTSYGISEVWPEESWQLELKQRFGEAPQTQSQDEKPETPPNAVKKRKLLSSFIPEPDDDDETDAWIPRVNRQPRKPRVTYRMAGTVVIGVAGLARRTGTTHDAIRFSQTIAAFGEKVACIELLHDDNRPLQVMTSLSMISPEESQDSAAIRRDGVDFFPNQTLEESIEIMGGGYAYVVVDFGAVFETDVPPWCRLEFVRADIGFVTITASPWDFLTLVQWQDERVGKRKPLSLLVHFADDKTYSDFMRPLQSHLEEELGIHAHQMPFDPHIVSTGDLKRSIYAQLLKPVMPQAVRRGRLFGN